MSGIRFIPSQSGVGSRVGIGLSAVVGPTGPRGYQGPAGVASLTGATGLQGYQGLVGATGPSNPGVQGYQGLIGATGPSNPGVQGYQGLIGATGPSNPGVQGFQGFVGATGAIGLQGLQGFVGATGATGLTGLQGLVGATGAVGSQGLQGLVGSTGSIGPQGGAGMGFVVFANTNSYTGLNTVIATGGNIGQFVLVLGGDLFVYAGTGSGYTGPGNSYGYAGDVTDESKLVGLQGVQGSIGPQGSQYTGPFTDLTVSGTSYLNNVIASNYMTGTNASFTTLNVTNLIVGGETGGVLYVNTGVITNLSIVNETITGQLTLASGASIGSSGDTIFTDASFNVANVFTVSAFPGDVSTTGTFIGASGSFSKFKASTVTVSGTTYLNDTISSGNMSGANGYFQNLAAQNFAAQGVSAGFGGLTVVGGTTLIGALQATGGLSAPSATISNLVVTGSITLPTGASAGPQGSQGLVGLQGSQGLVGLQGSQGLVGLQGSQYTGPFTELIVSGLSTLNNVSVSGYMTGTSASFSTINVTNLIVGGETGGYLYVNTGVITNLTVGNELVVGQLTLGSGATIGSSGDTIFTDASLNVANIFTVNAYNWDVMATGALRASSGSFGKLSIDNELHLNSGAYVTGQMNLGTGSSIGALGDTLFTDASLNVANIFTVNAYNWDVMATGSLIGTTGVFNNLKTTSLIATTATIPTLNVTNLTVGNETGGSLYISTGIISNLTVGTEIAGSITATTGAITNLISTNATIVTETITGTSYLNTVVVSGNMSGSNAFFQNLAGQNLAAQGASLGFSGLLVVGGTTLIGSLNATGGITTTSLSSTSETIGTSTITSLTATTATIPTLSSTTGTIINLSSTNATISSLTATTATIPTLNVTNLTVGNETGGILYVNTGVITNLTVGSEIAGSIIVTTGTITNLTSTNATITTATIPNLTVTNLVVGGETGGILYVNTGVITNLSIVNETITGQLVLASGASIGSASDTIFTDASLNIANIFTVNAYNWDVMATGSLRASSGSFGKLKVDNELNLATGAIVTGNLTLATGSSIASLGDTLFTDASLNIANIFTVNSYNWDVIATGALTASSGSFGKIKATTATVSGTTYLNDTVSSGNMSGANGYFLNLAGQNLAAQSATIGFNGLTVVGTTSLIGALYATGGINSQGITTTTLSTSYSSSTGTAGTVTSNTTRGKIVIPSGSTSATVTNSLITTDSSVFTTISPRIAGEFIEGVDVISGSFIVYLNSSSGSDININWLVIN